MRWHGDDGFAFGLVALRAVFWNVDCELGGSSWPSGETTRKRGLSVRLHRSNGSRAPAAALSPPYYLVSENDDEDSDGGMHEIMIYDVATERPIAKLTRTWRVNYRTGYTSGSMTREISFDPDGETLLINGGQGGDDGDVNRVPFVAALTAISAHCAAAPRSGGRLSRRRRSDGLPPDHQGEYFGADRFQ